MAATKKKMSIKRLEVPLRVDVDGVIRVAKTRVPLETVVRAFDTGADPKEIIRRYDSLDLADVYAVIAYCFKHEREVKAYVDARDLAARKTRAQNEDRFPTKRLRDR